MSAHKKFPAVARPFRVWGLTAREFARLELPRYRLARQPRGDRVLARRSGVPEIQIESFVATRHIGRKDLEKLSTYGP